VRRIVKALAIVLIVLFSAPAALAQQPASAPATTRAATLAELVAEQNLAGLKVATAHNGAFVPERARAGTPLAAGDRIEIVSPRQGG